MKKIVYVIGSLDFGGAERHLVQLAQQLAARGWVIEIYTLAAKSKNTLADHLGVDNITVKSLPNWMAHRLIPRSLRMGVNFLRLWWCFLRQPTAIIHFFLPAAYIIGMLAALLAFSKAPKIMSRRSLNHYQKNNTWLKKLEYRLHKKVDFVLANSQAVYDQLHDEEGLPREKLDLIYNGVAIQKFANTAARADSRKKLGIAENEVVLIILANLIPYKGHNDLITALAKINPQLQRPWRLLCVGRDDGIQSQLNQYAQSLGIAAHISWLGAQKEIPSLLAAADIGLLCSHQEGFSNAILECMAASLPLIVTNVGGNAESVVDQETGLVVPAHDPLQLGAAIQTLINDPASCKAYGIAGYQRVNQFFSLESCADQYEEFYLVMSGLVQKVLP